jgi:hypothetical protein
MSFSSLISGRGWQEDKARFRLGHYVRAHDVTVGPSGWHPHLHCVLLGYEALIPENTESLTNRLFGRWALAIERYGQRSPVRAYGISLEQARTGNDVSHYVCQVVAGDGNHPTPLALEVARGDLKASHHEGHRTPWQVLADFKQGGGANDLAIWHEWERSTAGVHAIRWSNGLRAELKMLTELTDEEIVGIAIGGEVIHTFTRPEWRCLVRRRGAMAHLLDLAERMGGPAITEFLNELLLASTG